MSNSLRPHGLYVPGNSPGQNTGVGSLSFLQEIFPIQGSNPGLLYCRWILYQLSHNKQKPQTELRDQNGVFSWPGRVAKQQKEERLPFFPVKGSAHEKIQTVFWLYPLGFLFFPEKVFPLCRNLHVACNGCRLQIAILCSSWRDSSL